MARKSRKAPVQKKGKSSVKRPTARALTFQSILLREARKFALLILFCGIPAYLYVLTKPENEKLNELNTQLVEMKRLEKNSIDAKDRINREIQAYKTNPEYLEIIARDHLNLYKPGETIIRIDR